LTLVIKPCSGFSSILWHCGKFIPGNNDTSDS
jgi:hypothetical protein